MSDEPKNRSDSPGDPMMNSLKSEAYDLLREVAEVGIDQHMSEGVLREVPILRLLAGLKRSIGIIRDLRFSRKVSRFLLGLREIPRAERVAFVDGLPIIERKRLGETLFVILDKLDDIDKPQILAKFFGALMKQDITREELSRLNSALDRVNLESLPKLRQYYDSARKEPMDGEGLEQFVVAGLLGLEAFGTVSLAGGAMSKNKLGPLFLKLLDS